MQRFTAGPKTGLFTDGFCEPNPGRGGWGAVRVTNDAVVEERCGGEPETTNNRMELKAIIEAYKMLTSDEQATIYTDSQLCLNTITKWAVGWERNGWVRKNGKKREPVKNLELVREAYELAQLHPSVRIEWLEGHAGNRWNEYADALSRKGTSDQ
ncbi:MAG: ribonuclease H [Dehalococcoidia bacterium]